MAVAVVLDFPGGTLEQYDNVIAKMGLTPEGQGPPGALSHWVAETDDGIRVSDLWLGRDEFEKFSEEQIRPFTAEFGLPEPQVTFFDVHNYLTAGQ
ncbi:hypothetical protein CBI38_35670 (plasmid) [Rhodococcus oxybenzonivorans]|uniref:ABM domain-containing protein n=1 Tax=Rhodococcus oxybenzonivorans TaxID=1990687 RepID=A0A2S2C7C7_9NOCA|nr:MULTISPECIES: hypothetical protein [Rhodococcus]AWK76770.1 hypothetical protein CBI38_35670 [Rhodococcus oxybenzonivorans]QHE74165.1 hypothetical protein GFS60_07859 [Rhodococcus sp. WAY2]